MTREIEGRVAASFRRVPRGAAAAAVAMGSLALLGWQIDSPVLKGIVPGLVAMNPATALCFILSGLSLERLWIGTGRGRSRRLGQACACLVALVGGLKLGGIITGWDPGIDQILFPQRLSAAGALHPNRMAPNTALNFLLLGIALCALSVEARGGRRPSKYVALPTLLLSLLALSGYAYGAHSFYGLSSYIPMALNTAFAFLLVSAGILLCDPEQGLTRVFASDDLGGSLARRLFPLSVGALLALGWMGLQGERRGLYGGELGVSLTIFLSSVLMGAVIWVSAHFLSRSDAERRRAAAALRAAHDDLEVRVRERTADLERANEALQQEMVERQRTQEALRRSEGQLRHAQKMEAVGTLAGGVAHDFNNLLTAIMGYAQLMTLRLRADDPALRDTEEILRAAERASMLTRQLLAFSRREVLQPKRLDLNAVVADIGKMLRRLIGEGIDLAVVPGEGLWAVEADPGHLEQVILNLAVNARDAMPEGGRLTVETANIELGEVYAGEHVGVDPGAYVLLAVSDTGVGMSAETKARIFEPFFTTKGPDQGTGLGLSTVYGIVKQWGGAIQVYSDEGWGTTFKIYLPRADGSPEPSTRVESLGKLPHGSETVLLAEDQDAVTAVVRATLHLCGYRVLEAHNGNEALALCRRHEAPIQLLVTDVVMPGMDGPELAARVRELHPETKILFISGYSERAFASHGFPDPRAAFLQKPFMPEALARKVREVLDAKEVEVP